MFLLGCERLGQLSKKPKESGKVRHCFNDSRIQAGKFARQEVKIIILFYETFEIFHVTVLSCFSWDTRDLASFVSR